MRGKRARNRHLAMYLKLLRFEVERFLSRACCHQHALAVWGDWAPIRDNILPIIEQGGIPQERVNMPAILEMAAAVFRLSEDVGDDETAVDGTVIDDLFQVHGGDTVKLMHAFIRVPLLPPRKSAPRRQRKSGEPTINVFLNKEGVL